MKCAECSAELNNYETFWDCPECGYFKEKAKYAKLEEQNEKFLKRFLGNDDIPAGCAVCDNPAYPGCQPCCLCSMIERFFTLSFGWLGILLKKPIQWRHKIKTVPVSETLPLRTPPNWSG